jgi:hypothetical protein
MLRKNLLKIFTLNTNSPTTITNQILCTISHVYTLRTISMSVLYVPSFITTIRLCTSSV